MTKSERERVVIEEFWITVCVVAVVVVLSIMFVGVGTVFPYTLGCVIAIVLAEWDGSRWLRWMWVPSSSGSGKTT